MAAKQNLKAFVRLDASGRVVPGSLIFRTRKPAEGRFMEIVVDVCCGVTTLGVFFENDSTQTVTVKNSKGQLIAIPAGETAVITVKELIAVTEAGAGTITYNIFDKADVNQGTGVIDAAGTIDLSAEVDITRIIFIDTV